LASRANQLSLCNRGRVARIQQDHGGGAPMEPARDSLTTHTQVAETDKRNNLSRP
ncbi:hypothetical protein JYU34_000026, partial [Plutella xylostella]